MKRLLFVCARNRLRSPTAEAVFAEVQGIETSSAGTAADAECVIDLGMVEWADSIFVMEARQKKFLQARFAEALKRRPSFAWECRTVTPTCSRNWWTC